MRIRCIQWTTLFVCIMLMASTLAGCFGGHDQDSDNSFGKNGKPYAGTSITAYMGVSPAADVIRSMLPEFESQTGLKVNLQILANEQLSQKLSVQLTAGSSNPDVFMIRPLEEVKLFHKNGWVQPLDEYVRRNPDYDFDDFSKSAIESTTADGKLISVPLSTEQQILYYRKDLLEQAGIPVPKTLDELEEAVKKSCMIRTMASTVLWPGGRGMHLSLSFRLSYIRKAPIFKRTVKRQSTRRKPSRGSADMPIC